MKELSKLVIGGLAAFLIVAIAQEWTFFSAAWFGSGETAPELSVSTRGETTRALYLYLLVSGHYYASGGDPRFADRLPAGDAVLAELRADVEYLGANERLQAPRLARLEVAGAELLGPGRVEVRTREWWHVRTLWLAAGTDSDPARAVKSFSRYLLVAGESGWRVEAWEPLGEDPAPGTTLEFLAGSAAEREP